MRGVKDPHNMEKPTVVVPYAETILTPAELTRLNGWLLNSIMNRVDDCIIFDSHERFRLDLEHISWESLEQIFMDLAPPLELRAGLRKSRNGPWQCFVDRHILLRYIR
jgi:hypothetical protein